MCIRDRYQAQSEGPQATVDAALERWFTDDFRSDTKAANTDKLAFVRRSILANDTTVYPQIYQVLVDGVNELVKPDPPITCPTLVYDR